MSATITIPVSDELLERLQKRAEAEGKTAEAVASEQLDRALPPRKSVFLEKWAGSINSGIPDVGLRHDEYLGQGILDTHDDHHDDK